MKNSLKTLQKTEDELRVGNYLALFGGEDLTGEHFTENTDFESNYTKTGMLYEDWEHGLDYGDPESPQRDDILGYVDWKTAVKDERGLWVERVLSRRNEYINYLEELIEAGYIGTSSEAVGGKVRKTEATSKTLGVKGGRFLAHPRLFGGRAVGVRQARIAEIRWGEQEAA